MEAENAKLSSHISSCRCHKVSPFNYSSICFYLQYILIMKIWNVEIRSYPELSRLKILERNTQKKGLRAHTRHTPDLSLFLIVMLFYSKHNFVKLSTCHHAADKGEP